MDESGRENSGAIALALSLGGVLLAALIILGANLLGRNVVMLAYLVFLAFQVAGLFQGIASRQQALGKTACVTSAVLAIGSVLFLA